MKKFPIVIGVSGHCDLSRVNFAEIKAVIKAQFEKIVSEYPNSEVKLLTSLAQGADQLCAEAALEAGVRIIVPLPMETADYCRDFNDEALTRFNHLLSQAERCFVVPYVEKTDRIDRDYRYRQADIYVASHCDCLIALWDGSKPKENGCGTAETVDMVLNHSYRSSGKRIRMDDGFVMHIYIPRNENKERPDGEISYLGNHDFFIKSCQKRDDLNREGGDPDALSMLNQNRYHNLLKLIAVLGTVVTIAFLLYDEAMMLFMLVVLGIALVLMYIAYRYANRSKYHEKYIEYRMLAECLRTQNHVNGIGSSLEAADYLDWNRCFDTLWIYKAMKAEYVIPANPKPEDLRKDWLWEQQEYHLKAADMTENLLQRNRRIVKAALYVSIATYLYALLFEYVPFFRFTDAVETVRMIIKIIIGAFSSFSLFAANYYGKLSLDRVYEDHIRMADFYRRAIDYLDQHGADECFIGEIIDEELSETSNWCSYEKDNTIDLAI